MGTQSMSSPIGTLLITSENGFLTGVRVGGFSNEKPDEITAETARQLNEYFEQRRQSFQLPVRFKKGGFYLKVWEATASIPYGKTATYGEVAALAGSPFACRSVGSCLNRNELLIVVPCHRVVAKSGMGGFALGLNTKKFLLDLEKAVLK